MGSEKKYEAIERLADAVAAGSRVVSVADLTSTAAKAYVISHLRELVEQPLVIVTDSNSELEAFRRDIEFHSGVPAVALPSFETDPYSGASPHAETQEVRALALWQLTRSTPDISVITARSLIARTPLPDEIRTLGADIVRDRDMPPDELIERLVAAGYVREDPIDNFGQFSVRGGIIDIWPPNAADPVRIEFFGDTVDSIRSFDAETQLSTGQLKETAIAPMREFAVTPDGLKEWAMFAEEHFADERFARNLKDRIDFAVEGETFPGWEFLIPLSKPRAGSVLDFFDDAVLVIDEPVQIEQTLSVLYDRCDESYAEITEVGDLGLPPEKLFATAEELRRRLDTLPRIELRSLGRMAARTDDEFALGSTLENDPADILPVRKNASTKPLFLFPTAPNGDEISILSRTTRKFHGDVNSFANALRADAGSAKIVLQTTGIAERLDELLRDHNVTLEPNSAVVGELSAGFEIPQFDIAYYTETDIFGEAARSEISPPRSAAARKRSKLGAFISDFRDLKPGDFVVHIDHGIGRFEGLQTIETGGSTREFVLLYYADDSKLFVPVERLDLVSRYSSGEAITPTLDRLGGIGWQKTKAKAKRAMRDMADELLRLYAERKLVQGYAFSPDAPWQHEFEDAFPFELTADQASAIEDVKDDMQTPRPMDRLIVGDVGYGKTEVAMRAAFKAVMDGKQVAVLAPTTILAYQHFESFKKRFAAFPATIELMSRFRTAKEQKAVVESAEKGNVDVLIGTHRILSADVKLPNLGLVVVDEEQRFGVAHKEKLKQMKKKVDVLTLSATPIPRTLNMSLLGMRDMSVIETPPRDRLAINTQVVQFGEGVIKTAIESELSRNGQVFFIHNRVESIESVAALIQKIVPNARIAIGHGQMNEKEMEQVMLDFIDHKYDILVATTIIENGIDIPRANTIIINRADNYGLSQLYQLRGRVGRSNRRAYAYLLIPSELELTPIARRRLSAIREFSDLGAGFRIAALDLELRGAGNLLGGHQSGHLDALGFDLYTKMLERTIAEIRGEDIADEMSTSINLGVDVSIPKDFIADTGQRLRTYKRISSAGSEEELIQIHSEVEDRYGRISGSAESLFAFARLRKLAESMHIVSIDRAGGSIAVKLDEASKVSPEKIMAMAADTENVQFSPSGILRVKIPADGDVLAEAAKILENIREN